MRSIQVSEFEARCLEILDEVANTGEGVTILEQGRSVARLLPYAAQEGRYLQEPLQGTEEVGQGAPDNSMIEGHHD